MVATAIYSVTMVLWKETIIIIIIIIISKIYIAQIQVVVATFVKC